MRAQTTQTFANMAITLQEAGGSLADLVQTQVTLTDWHAYREYNEVYNRHVQAPFPTNSTFQEVWGVRGSSSKLRPWRPWPLAAHHRLGLHTGWTGEPGTPT